MHEALICVVEIPKGSRNKYEWDESQKMMMLDRFLSASVVFPTDYGYIKDSLAEDGDPLDVLVAVSEPTFSGCGIRARPVAVLWLSDQGAHEPKVLAVPVEDPNWQKVRGLDDLSEQLVEEISHFFVSYKSREGHEAKAAGWGSTEEANEIVEAALERAGAD